jgi:hypothetical protein
MDVEGVFMTAPANPPKKDEIASRFADDTLVHMVDDRFAIKADDPLLLLVSELHNEARIDLLTLTDSKSFQALARDRYFAVRNFLCAAIPSLEAPVGRMIDFVAQLVALGKNDLTANNPYAALTKWLAVDKARASEVIARARSGEAQAMDHLTFALQALGDLTEARDFVASFTDTRRLAALTAVSRIPHTTSAERTATVQAIELIQKEPADDLLRATALQAIFNTFASEQLSPDAISILTWTLQEAGPATQHSAAVALWDTQTVRTPQLVDLLLDYLSETPKTQQDTIGFIDQGLCKLLAEGYSDKAIGFVASIVAREHSQVELNDFDSFMHAVVASPTSVLGAVVARWLAIGHHKLCEGLRGVLRAKQDTGLDIPMAGLGFTDTDIYFLCRRAVGYFFLEPVLAGSILVAALRTAGGELASKISALLFDPLLVNYGGSLQEFLQKIPKDDSAYKLVRQALDKASAYAKGLESAGLVKELHPSEHQRQLAHIRWADTMRDAFKKAHKQSIFMDIVHKSTLLYGRRSVAFVEGPEGKLHPHEMELGTYGTTHEWPRMEITDPVRLDETIRVLRLRQRHK